MPKSSKGKKKRSTSSASKSSLTTKEPMAPSWLPPPEALGEKLLKALEYKPLDERELYGYKISKRAIKNLSPAEIKDLCEVFQTFDRDHTGFLKSKELYYALKALGFNITEDSCKQFIEYENEGTNLNAISLNQFLDLIIDKQSTSKDDFDELVTAFKLFDIDDVGEITLENLRKACIEADLQLTETELREMILEADQNGDGVVDQSEFISVMLKTNLY